MRSLILTILAIVAVSAAAPARAQNYDPRYPVCLHLFDMGINSIQCSFTSLAQCRATASGRAAMCEINPYAAEARAPVGPNRRNRRDY